MIIQYLTVQVLELGEFLDYAEPGLLETQDVESIWAGTGVGLVKRLERAASIVREVRQDTGMRLNRAIVIR